MEYADDMSHISSDMRNIKYAKKMLPSKLISWDLIMNEGKTEDFTIKRNGQKTWKKLSSWERCRYWRGCKAKKSTFNECRELNKEIFLREISIEVKICSFNCYLSSVFLHNCDTWTLTKTRSQVITRREPSWFGHLFYYSDDTPAKIALEYSLRQTKKPRRRLWTTWISMMKMKLLGMGLEWEAANRLAEDRLVWNKFIEWVSPMEFLHAN